MACTAQRYLSGDQPRSGPQKSKTQPREGPMRSTLPFKVSTRSTRLAHLSNSCHSKELQAARAGNRGCHSRRAHHPSTCLAILTRNQAGHPNARHLNLHLQVRRSHQTPTTSLYNVKRGSEGALSCDLRHCLVRPWRGPGGQASQTQGR